MRFISKETASHRKNLERTKGFLKRIWHLRGTKSILYANEANINFSNVDPADILSFVEKFSFHDSIKREFELLIQFILEHTNVKDNSGTDLLRNFSVVLKQTLSGEEEFEINGCNIKSVHRKLSEGSNDANYRIPSLLDSDKDDTFDIITVDVLEEYKKAGNLKAKMRRKLRNESRIPLLVVILINNQKSSEVDSPLQSETIPALYFSLPAIGQKRLVYTRS